MNAIFPDQSELNMLIKSIDKYCSTIKFHLIEIDSLVKSNKIQHSNETLTLHLRHRVHDVIKSYIYCKYYYSLNIPDSQWFADDYSNLSTSFFPKMDSNKMDLKDYFDYYSDVFFYKLFSVFDNMAKILNNFYYVNNKYDITFYHIIYNSDMCNKNNNLCSMLKCLYNNNNFKKIKILRNDCTHNNLPNAITITSTNIRSGVEFGVNYITSYKMMYNINKSMIILKEILSIVAKNKNTIINCDKK